ncbi:MAG: hexapeptide transferase [Flexibacter sp. CG_4_10_14_3_um_filter_32_15]|nr:MAG: hexapeptide transferase [Flexibacter sp. CG_4_10_14_3_um_filter_32_15]
MLIIGAKGHAKEVLQVFHQKKEIQNLYFFDDISTDTPSKLFNQFEIITNLEAAKKLFISSLDNRFVLGIGNPYTRFELVQKMKKIGGKLSNVIASSALIGNYDVFMEEGVDIMPFSIIMNSVSIKEGTLINRMVNISHDTEIGMYSELAPNTTVSGNCRIGSFCFLGTGSIILPNVQIGNNVKIGAGAVVTQNIESNSVAVGVPAKIIKKLDQLNFEL